MDQSDTRLLRVWLLAMVETQDIGSNACCVTCSLLWCIKYQSLHVIGWLVGCWLVGVVLLCDSDASKYRRRCETIHVLIQQTRSLLVVQVAIAQRTRPIVYRNTSVLRKLELSLIDASCALYSNVV
jgi:hypothetical protein